MHFLPLDIAPDIHQLIGYIHFLDDIEAFPRREIKRRTSFIITSNWFWILRVQNVISIQLEILRRCLHLGHVLLWENWLIQMILKLQKDTLFYKSLIQLLLINIASRMQRSTYAVPLYTVVFPGHIKTIVSLFEIYLCDGWIESSLSQSPVFKGKACLSDLRIIIFIMFGVRFIHHQTQVSIWRQFQRRMVQVIHECSI